MTTVRPLGRLVHHDPASRAFSSDLLVDTSAPIPPSAAHERMCRPFDQGHLGSCTGNALAGALMTDPLFDPTRILGEPDAVTLYSAATRVDRIGGVYPPDDTGSSGLAVCKAAKALGWITAYHHAFSFTSMLRALAVQPVIVGVNWYDSFDHPDPNGHVEILPGASVRGGHEFELVGYDTATETVSAVNSWGTTWGNGGYFTIGFTDVRRLLHEHGDATVAVR